MKSKIHNRAAILKYIISKERFKGLYFLTLVLAVYGAWILGLGSDNFWDSILIPFQFFLFNILLFCIFSMNILSFCETFSKEFSYYISRLQTKKRYLKELMINSMLLQLYLLILFIILFVAFKLLFSSASMTIYEIEGLGITNLQFLLFYLFRYFLLLFLLEGITVLLYFYFGKKGSALYNLLLLAGLIVSNYFDILAKPWFLPWKYFTGVGSASFSQELTFSILYIVLLSIVLLFFLFFERGKNPFKKRKFFLLSDIQHILKRRIYIPLLMIFVPLISSFLFLSSEGQGSIMIQNVMGLEFKMMDLNFVQTICYLVNISTGIFLIIDVFTKDLRYQLDNIFLRIKAQDWFFIKTFLFSLDLLC